MTKAKTLHTLALDYFDQVQDHKGIPVSQHNLATQMLHRGEIDDAELLERRVLRSASDLKDSWLQCAGLINLGIVYAERGDPNTAIKHFEEALVLARMSGDTYETCLIQQNLAFMESQRGNYSRAAALLKESEQVAETIQAAPLIARNLVEQGLLFLHMHEYAAAVEVSRRGGGPGQVW